MFYYKHHIGDYRRDTGHLSLLEHGAYRQLLDLYYVDEKPIPNETDWVMRRLSAKTQAEKDAVLAVLSDFFTQDADGWHHKRCDFEIKAYEDKSEKNKENGKLGGRPKKKAEINPKITHSVLNGNPNQSENNLNLLTNKPNNLLTKEPKNKSATAPTAYADLLSNIPRQLVDDWTALRKSKKSAITRTAIDGIILEAGKAGITLEDALRECCERGWAGFKASWLDRPKANGHVNKQEALEASNRAVVERLLAKEARYAQQ